MGKRKPKRLACRWCGDKCEHADSRDHRSAWTHGHPAVCPFRQDKVPVLNGVHVGDVWRNLHTGDESTVLACRLGGHGTYVDREPVYVMTSGRDDWHHEMPLWSLVEHWDPITRPDEYPVPWHVEEEGRGRGMRTADDEWRCPYYRGSTNDRPRAYWHATHRMDEQQHGCIDWRSDRWQIDPDDHQAQLDLSYGEPLNENRAADEQHAAFLASQPAREPQPGEQLTLA